MCVNIFFSFDDVLDAKYFDWSFKETVSANGCSVLPGFVDAHTHPVWVGDRVNEFAMKVIITNN